MLTIGARVTRADGVTIEVVSVDDTAYVLRELDGPSWPMQRFSYVVLIGTERAVRWCS